MRGLDVRVDVDVVVDINVDVDSDLVVDGAVDVSSTVVVDLGAFIEFNDNGGGNVQGAASDHVNANVNVHVDVHAAPIAQWSWSQSGPCTCPSSP